MNNIKEDLYNNDKAKLLITIAWLYRCVDTWIRTKDPHHVKVIL